MDPSKSRRPATVQKARKGVTKQPTVSGKRTTGSRTSATGTTTGTRQRKKLPGRNPQSASKSSPMIIYIIAVASVIMLCGIAAIVIVKLGQSKTDPTVPALSSFRGDIRIIDGSTEQGRTPVSGYRLLRADRVILGKGGEADLAYDGGTAFKLTSEANLQVAGPLALNLNIGSISGATSKLEDGKTFTVETPHCKALVNPVTTFVLKVDKVGTRLNVMRGSVDFLDKIRKRRKVFADNQTAFVPIETVVTEKKPKKKAK